MDVDLVYSGSLALTGALETSGARPESTRASGPGGFGPAELSDRYSDEPLLSLSLDQEK